MIGAALLTGSALGYSLNLRTVRRRGDKAPADILRSVTRLLFVTTQLAALSLVSVSYGIAVYSTVVLMQPFPVVELSQQAITTILGVTALKVVENIFEHNEGPVFGQSTGAKHPEAEQEEPPDCGTEE